MRPERPASARRRRAIRRREGPCHEPGDRESDRGADQPREHGCHAGRCGRPRRASTRRAGRPAGSWPAARSRDGRRPTRARPAANRERRDEHHQPERREAAVRRATHRCDIGPESMPSISSGRARATTATTSIVITASPRPISMWTPPMAGSATLQGDRAGERELPGAGKAAATVEHQAAKAVASSTGAQARGPTRAPAGRRRNPRPGRPRPC